MQLLGVTTFIFSPETICCHPKIIRTKQNGLFSIRWFVYVHFENGSIKFGNSGFIWAISKSNNNPVQLLLTSWTMIAGSEVASFNSLCGFILGENLFTNCALVLRNIWNFITNCWSIHCLAYGNLDAWKVHALFRWMMNGSCNRFKMFNDK